MRNSDVISGKLEEALTFLYEQDAKLKPTLDFLTGVMKDKLKSEELSAKDVSSYTGTIYQ